MIEKTSVTSFTKHKQPKKVARQRESGRISYSCLREAFMKKIVDLGLPPEDFGLHNLRAGGATTVANSKVPDRCFKRHGR